MIYASCLCGRTFAFLLCNDTRQGGAMFLITPDPLVNEELLRGEDPTWEILIEDNAQDIPDRYWFKQNFINQNSRQELEVTYH